MPDVPNPPRPLTGRRPLTRPRLFSQWLPPERQSFPCHPRMPAMLLVDHDQPLQFWEYHCAARGCDWLYRFTKRDDWLSWEPIDGFTVPASKRPYGEPIDPAAVLKRLIRERRPAA